MLAACVFFLVSMNSTFSPIMAMGGASPAAPAVTGAPPEPPGSRLVAGQPSPFREQLSEIATRVEGARGTGLLQAQRLLSKIAVRSRAVASGRHE